MIDEMKEQLASIDRELVRIEEVNEGHSSEKKLLIDQEQVIVQMNCESICRQRELKSKVEHTEHEEMVVKKQIDVVKG